MVKWIWCARGLSQTNPWTFNDCCVVFGIGLCLLCTSSSHQQTHPGIMHGESWSVHAQTQARHHWGAADEGPSSWGEKQATNGEVRKWWWCLGGREWIMKVYFYSLQCVLSALRKDCQEMMFFFSLDVYLCTILLSGLCSRVRKKSEKMLRRKQRRLLGRPWSWWRDWDRLRNRQSELKMVWRLSECKYFLTLVLFFC